MPTWFALNTMSKEDDEQIDGARWEGRGVVDLLIVDAARISVALLESLPPSSP